MAEAMIARLSQPDIADLLPAPEPRPDVDMTALRAESRRLHAKRDDLARLLSEDVLTEAPGPALRPSSVSAPPKPTATRPARRELTPRTPPGRPGRKPPAPRAPPAPPRPKPSGSTADAGKMLDQVRADATHERDELRAELGQLRAASSADGTGSGPAPAETTQRAARAPAT